jgi:uncharacterized Zn-binding protein involved in type VI secretion
VIFLNLKFKINKKNYKKLTPWFINQGVFCINISMAGIAIHRDTDSRKCGASTIVNGQKDVFVNGLLASVKGDPNTHGGGALNANNNDGTVYINKKLVVLLGSGAAPDKLCPIPPHCGPTATGASEDVYACGGGKVEPIGSDTSYSVRPSGSSGGGTGGSSNSSRSGGRDTSPQTTNTPVNTGGAKKVEPDYTNIEKLENDPEFSKKLDEMQTKYPGLTREELYSIIQGESSFNRTVVSSAGATGLFQFTPDALSRLNNIYGTSYTTAKIQQMSAAEQLEVYDRYLQSYDYNSDMGLGIIQAAPAYRFKSPDFEAYPIGSNAWNQNSGWRGPDGRITVQSINDYYDRFRK